MTRNFGFRQVHFRDCRFRSLAVAVVALIALSPIASAFAQKNITVLANYTFHGRHSPFFVAVDKGYFTEAGFKADVQPATGSGFVISAIESGKADYGLADASTTMQAIAKGSKVKGFQVYMDISTNGLASLTPIPTPESALGKTIAVSPTDSTRVIYPIILKQKGLDPSKINWVAATPATYITLLLSGQADLIAATVDGDMPPLMETAAKQNKKVYFSSFGSWGYDVLGFVFIASSDTLAKDPDGARRFAAAMKKAVEFSMANPEEAAKIMVKYNPTLSYDITLAQWRQSMTAINTDYMKANGYGVATPDRVNRTINLLKDAFQLNVVLKPEDVWLFGAATR
jgi:NitT/TauT family transport system substrate-binding protein